MNEMKGMGINMDINWFPGHMAKALKDVKESLKKVDMVIETCDARVPFSSRNPELDKILGTKPRILVLNKSDLADEALTREWISWFEAKGIRTISLEGTNKATMKKLKDTCLTLCADKIERAMNKGRLIRPIRAMVVGIPNTGKSTIINTMSGRKVTATSDRPGVTRSSQWVRTDDHLELMDMPGVLWPKIGERDNQICLAATGAIRDTVLDAVEVAFETMQLLLELYPERLKERYQIDPDVTSGFETFETAAKKRGCILSGGRIDTERFAVLFLDEVRGGKLGRMTLERP
jgi:ribosome biogenesis GTPase A